MAWVRKLNNPEARGWTGGRLGVVGPKYYCVGGGFGYWGYAEYPNYLGRSRRCDEFDPVLNTWTAKADMPYFLGAHAVCSDGEYVYALLGSFGVSAPPQFGDASGSVFRYDPVANIWESLSDEYFALDNIRLYSAASVIDGLIYVVGGITAPYSDTYESTYAWTVVNRLDVYDIEARYWMTFEPDGVAIPHTGVGLCTVGADNRLYIAATGGTRHVVYDPATNTATELAPLPYVADPDAPATYTQMGAQHIFQGGDINGGDYSNWTRTFMYTPSSDTWTETQALASGASAAMAGYGISRGAVVLTGGHVLPVSTDYRADTFSWERVPVDLPATTLEGEGYFSLVAEAVGAWAGEGAMSSVGKDVFVGGMVVGVLAAGSPLETPADDEELVLVGDDGGNGPGEVGG